MPDLLERLKSALADRYAVESEIGRGGMATVFLAEDLKHRRKVAIKVLHPELAASLGTDRFLREIEIAAGLEHTHILALIDSGEADGLPYYVMPYVEGESLRELLERDGQLPIDQALGVAVEVADGLAYAHDRGVVHRDIKPGNILLSAGHARIADFGVARAVGVASGGDTTATGLAVGTPKYMSPEQASAGEVDGRSDIYALGCVLWEMLAGEPPWDAPTPHAILARKTAETTPDLRVRRKSVPADVEAVIARAMAAAPADRFATAGEFAGALKEPTLVGREARRRRTLRQLAGAVVAIVLLVTGIWLARSFTGEEAAEEAAVEIDPAALAVLPFSVVGTNETLGTVARGIPRLFWTVVTGEFGPSSVDPGTVAMYWAAAGGTVETPLAEGAALEVAEAVGAGGLVQGVVSGTEEEMSLTATLLEVPGGRIRVRRVTVEGPYGDLSALVDDLINQLLAIDRGPATAADLPSLRERDPEAVLAYMVGDFDKAIALDSTFVLAALLKVTNRESEVETARFVWAHQNELSPRDRRAMRAVIGWRFGETQTLAQRFAQYDSIGGRDWEKADLSWQLWVYGRLAGIPRYRDRPKAAYIQWREFGWDAPWFRMVLSDIAAEEGDTAALLRHAAEIGPLARDPQEALIAVAVRLRVALMQGDTIAADSLWQRAAVAGDSALWFLEPLLMLLVDGNGLDGLDRFMLSEQEAKPDGRRTTAGTGLAWARARGRYSDWTSIRDRAYNRAGPLRMPVLTIRDALFLGEPVDSTVFAAASWLDSVAADQITLDSMPADPEPEIHGPALARCWSTLWKIAHGDTEEAAETLRYLREDVLLPYRYSVCAGFIEVFVAEQTGGDIRAAVTGLDSVVRPVPMDPPWGFIARDGTGWIDNLFLSRKLLQVGDTASALAAARRAKPWSGTLNEVTWGTIVDLLREEARLTAMVGDTAGAIDAYEHYFKLRDTRPESPHWAAQWDSMRVEYGALTGVEGP